MELRKVCHYVLSAVGELKKTRLMGYCYHCVGVWDPKLSWTFYSAIAKYFRHRTLYSRSMGAVARIGKSPGVIRCRSPNTATPRPIS